MKKKRKSIIKKAAVLILSATLAITGTMTENISIMASSEKKAVDQEVLSSSQADTLYKEYFAQKEYNRVSVHDPSIVAGYIDEASYTGKEHVYGEQNASKTRKKIYFIFGSYLAFAYSTDLMNWNYFQNNLHKDYKTVFKVNFDWASRGNSAYNPKDHMWAPDVIWDAEYDNGDGTKGAWLMYMSISGASWNSSIALLTAKSLNEDWTYRDTIVYSGFTASGVYTYKDTNYEKVTGESSLPAHFIAPSFTEKDNGVSCEPSTWNINYGIHAIDPCITMDGKNMWMSYGSFFGGIWLLRINPATGLRDDTIKYPYQKNVSDPYMGYQLAGGNHASGEASYIQKFNGKYYLFLSYGGLAQDGGYNIRVFSSDSITGPYKDQQGQDARRAYTPQAGSINGSVGNRLMTYYQWEFAKEGPVAQGHNSTLLDDDGKLYLVFHTRFNNRHEEHEVRTYQLFAAKNGSLVVAPFEYSGETLSRNAYTMEQAAGEYNIITMKGTDYKKLECVSEEKLLLKEDGTVSGAYSGIWSQSTDGPYLTISTDKNTYQGVFIEQNREGTNCKVMGLTLVGDNDLSFFGYKNEFFDDKANLVYNVKNPKVTLPKMVNAGTQLDFISEGFYGVKYKWESQNTSIITNDGMVQNVSAGTNVKVKLTMTKGTCQYSRDYTITVLPETAENPLLPLNSSSIAGEYATKNDANTAVPSKVSMETGLSFSMYAKNMADDWVTVLQNKEKTTMLQFATISYSLNNVWCWYYEAFAILSDYAKSQGYNASNIWTAFMDGTNGAYYLTISFNKDGSISYYRDGKKMMTYSADLKPSNGNVAVTIADITKSVINDYLSGKLEFVYDISDIVVGYEAAEQENALLTIIPEPEENTDSVNSNNLDNSDSLNNPNSSDNLNNLDNDNDSSDEMMPAAKGTTFHAKEDNCRVKVTSSSSNAPKVAYIKNTGKKASAAIPNTVEFNEITYRVTAIYDKAFSGDKKIQKLTIGKSVVSIGKDAFKNCKNLKKIIIKGTSLKKVGADAFKGISDKAVIQVPKAKKAAYKKLFQKRGFKGKVK